MTRSSCVLVLAAVAAILSINLTVHAEDSWADILKTNDLERVAKIMALRSPPWPCLQTEQPSDANAAGRSQTSGHESPANVLLAKVRECEKDGDHDLDHMIRTYSKVRQSATAAGGLLNLSLANAVDRIALSRICAYLVSNPAKFEHAGRLLNELGIPRFSDQQFAKEANAEAHASERPAPFDETSESTARASIRSKIGEQAALAADLRNGTKRSGLIDGRHGALLYHRLREVALMNEVSLPALIAFLRKGGQLTDLRLDDTSRFKEVIGAERTTFSNEALGVKRVHASDLHALVEEYSRGVEQSQVYKTALE